MKILLIDVNYKNSSTGKIVHDLAERLIKDGHETKVLYGRGTKVNDGIASRISTNIEVYFHAMMTRITGLTGIYSYFATRKAIQKIKKFKPDVIHLHELHGYYLNYSKVINYIKKNNIPVVWTFHCEFAYTGKCGHAYDCEKWKTQCHSCPELKSYPSSIYFDFTKYMFNKKKKDFNNFNNLIIVTPSKWLADRVNESFLSQKDIRVIYNGIDTENIFKPSKEQYPKDPKKKIVLSVAPNIMDIRKGGKWVIELAKMFDENVQFILIGTTAEIPNLPINVKVLKKTNNQQELAEYYSKADLFVLTSQKETFSLVTAESLACGTPVMGFESGAPSEVAPAGYGLFVPYGDINLLSQKINLYFANKLPLKSEDQCRDFAIKNYSKTVMYNRYLSLYNESINHKKG